MNPEMETSRNRIELDKALDLYLQALGTPQRMMKESKLKLSHQIKTSMQREGTVWLKDYQLRVHVSDFGYEFEADEFHKLLEHVQTRKGD